MLGAACAWLDCAAFDLQGHRGARGLAPENTIEGFRIALAVGVDTLEMDLAITRDGVVVVSHDPRLNPDITRGPDGRYLPGPGPAIHDLTLEGLKAYDVGRIRPGSRYARRFPHQQPVDGARIPSLAEVAGLLERAGAGHIRLNVEIKTDPGAPELTPSPEAFAEAVIHEIEALGLADRTTIQSFHWRALAHVRRIAPHIPTVCLTAERPGLDTVERGRRGPSPWTGLDVRDFAGHVPVMVHAFGCAIWSPHHEDLDRADLARAHALGLAVIPWTVNDAAGMRRLIAFGVDGMITDYPDRLRRVMAEHGLPLPPPVVPD